MQRKEKESKHIKMKLSENIKFIIVDDNNRK